MSGILRSRRGTLVRWSLQPPDGKLRVSLGLALFDGLNTPFDRSESLYWQVFARGA
ncbi:hypothetical protein BSF38_02325 [Paludisphaera borealis]|uniref:Uncharacterized protein n=1 Tax=Paludisphaera borealis TaxID=1387353 RepID=A0A1U7CPG9_9BACT|nr:hypothetical protein BSF38_02325 [Paludisphaera borealis]